MLKDALGDGWVVERVTDYMGEISIIAFPVAEHEGTPSFILFETEGRARLAAVKSDAWGSDQSFASFSEAVSAFIAVARAYQPYELCNSERREHVQALEDAAREQ